ncbi:hypothetical protein [Pararhodobacter sp.]|uniref:hypothetical protein n=1 Tax=Pararhodobacter sp. TaxID=2127056 RepID=UPI002FDCAF6D
MLFRLRFFALSLLSCAVERGCVRVEPKMMQLLRLHNTPVGQCCYAANAWRSGLKKWLKTAALPPKQACGEHLLASGRVVAGAGCAA